MATKTREATRHVVAVIYAPASEPSRDLEAAAERFTDLLRIDCRAAKADWQLQ
jgi:DNA/RNA-binding domain of Phe-tRNA-synthetase-like protein